jgi:hypothetical protein
MHWPNGSAKKIPMIGFDMTDPVFQVFFLYVCLFLALALIK